MTVHTTGQRWKIHGDFVCVAIGRGHVPHVPAGVKIDRSFEIKAVNRKEIGRAAPPLTDVIQKLASFLAPEDRPGARNSSTLFRIRNKRDI